jgi:hypothetical protein
MTNKAALFALVSALVAAVAGCSGGGSSAGTTGTSAGVPTTPAVSSGSPSAVQARPYVAPTTASASRRASNAADTIKLSPSSATSVVAWYHGNGGAAFTSLTKALDQASSAKATGGIAAFEKNCGQIGTTAKEAEASPPMPVSSAAQWYTTALKGYVQSAADCQQGVSTQDEKLIQQAAGEVETNNSYLNRAAAVLIAALSAGK